MLASSLLAFAFAAALLTMLPGLDTALVLRTAAVEGPRRALLAGLGINLGCLVWGLAAAFGIGAVLAISTLAYQTLKIVGALYLLYLGWGLLRRRPAALAETAKAGGESNWLLRGLMTNLLNPKVGMFYMTLMPQFIPAHANAVALSVAMAGIHASESMLWFGLLTLATRPMARWLQQPRVQTALDRLTGLMLVACGLKLVAEVRR